MVLEALIDPVNAEKTPSKLFLYGFIYATIALVLSLWIFREEASIVMVLLTVIACIPIMYSTIKYEESKDSRIHDERLLIKEHGKALKAFTYLFLGILAGYTLGYLLLPESMVADLFNSQLKTIARINGGITGQIIGGDIFVSILANNLKVLLFCLIFAIFYGAGAIFILAWNASVIAAAVGMFVKTKILSSISYFHVVPLALLRYMTHGIFEIFAYIIAGLAGGIISVAVIKHEFGSEKFRHVMKDSVDLIILAVLVLFLAALIEVYITPVMF
jgi:stage II sporulation protein M